MAFYLYYDFSIRSFKQKYHDHFLSIKEEIISEINQVLDQGDSININRIIETYLDDTIDFLAVYRNDGEIIQIFTKKGITKNNLKIVDNLYSSHKNEMEGIYILEEEKQSSSITNQSDLQNLNPIIMTVITPQSENIPYRYLLLFNPKMFVEGKEDIENSISRNSFFIGLMLLGLMGLIFFLGELFKRNQQKKLKENHHNKLFHQEVHRIVEEKVATENTSQPISNEKQIALPSQEKIHIQDYIEHDKEDKFFSEIDLVEENWDKPKKPKKDHFQENEDSNKDSIKKIFVHIISPLTEVIYEPISDHFKEPYSQESSHPLRSLEDIITMRENLVKRRSYDPRLKQLLGIWLFPSILKNSREKEKGNHTNSSFNELFVDLVNQSLQLITNSHHFRLDEHLIDYPSPAALLYFRPGFHSEQDKLFNRLVLTATYPDYLCTLETTPFVVPWLGQEKKFFKIGLPYIEKKPLAVSIIFLRIINNIPHVIKSVYTPKSYEQFSHEQKLELFSLLEVFFNCLEYFPELYRNLVKPIPLVNKVRHWFQFIFNQDKATVNLLTTTTSSPPLLLILWTFDEKTYPKNVKIGFQDLMEYLLVELHRELKGQEIFFLQEKNRILSLGYNDFSEKDGNSLKERIKKSIEKILIEKGGLEIMQLNWKDVQLPIPDGPQEEKINEIFLEKV